MPIDIMKYVDENTNLTDQQKIALFDGFCEKHGYKVTYEDDNGNPVPNPESKKDFVNRKFKEWICAPVNKLRHEKATYTKLAL